MSKKTQESNYGINKFVKQLAEDNASGKSTMNALPQCRYR